MVCSNLHCQKGFNSIIFSFKIMPPSGTNPTGRVHAPVLNAPASVHLTKMCCGTEAGSYLRLIDSCVTQLKAQGPFRTCNENEEEEEEEVQSTVPAAASCHPTGLRGK